MVTRIVWLGNVCLLLSLLFLSFFQPAPVFAATNRGPLHCSPCSLAFGNVNLTKSKSLSVTLSNRQTSSITVTKVLKYAPGFQVSGLTLPLTLAGGKSASFSIIFQPQSNQATRGSINLVSSGSKTALSISVSGTGLTSGSLTAHPASINFGTVPLGTSVEKTQSLTNSGSVNVTIGSVTSGNPFWVSGISAPMTLAPGASVTFYAHFHPLTSGTASGSIAAFSSANDYRIVTPLSATVPGSGQLSISPSTLNFGSVSVGSRKSLQATLSATGAGITISSASMTSSEFSVSGLPLPLSLAAGQNKSFTITFTPQSSGTASASLSLKTATSTAAFESLAGSGVAAAQHSVSLSWKPSPSQVVGYNVYRGSKSGGPFSRLNSATDAATTYTDSSVQGGQTYYYVVTAVDSRSQESTHSNQAQAIVPAP